MPTMWQIIKHKFNLNKCEYCSKKKNILPGYFWCDYKRKVYKDTSCERCYYYQPKFPKSLFIFIKELFNNDR
jgi:hypothetical protein